MRQERVEGHENDGGNTARGRVCGKRTKDRRRIERMARRRGDGRK
jgi:hypothetical protein